MCYADEFMSSKVPPAAAVFDEGAVDVVIIIKVP